MARSCDDFRSFHPPKTRELSKTHRSAYGCHFMDRSVGLVLGAGGSPGWSYLVGALAALHAVTGWDPRRADLILGTSAGAGVGALLRCDVSAGDLLAAQSTPRAATLAAEPEAEAAPGVDPRRDRDWIQAARMGWRGIGSWPPRPGLLLAAASRPGAESTVGLGDRMRTAAGGRRWPEQPYWAAAVSTRSGRRVVFGRDGIDTDIGTAVQASSAVVGVYAPVSVKGTDYIDGGFHSATNADLAAGLGLAVVVVLAPLSTTATRPTRLNGRRGLERSYHRSVLRRECSIVTAAGSVAHIIEPDGTLAAQLDGAPADRSRRADLAELGFSMTVRRLETDVALAECIASLGSQAAPPASPAPPAPR